ncbi:MAG: SusF/SusE family outer membrane protein [Bacteroidales bacterium]
MKKIFLGAGIFALFALGACQDNNETVINPEGEAGTLTFELHQPDASDKVYTLLEDDAAKVMETLTYEKPDYGFNSVPSYTIQVSLDPGFRNKNTQMLKSASMDLSIELITQEINSAILNLHEKADGLPDITEAQSVFVRIVSTVSPVVKPSYSTPITLNVIPYEIQNVALPATYYLIGLGGEWGNEATNVGTELIPMSLVKDYPYDKATGKGEFVYTGYFKAKEGFKIIGIPGNWDKDSWGMTDGQFTYEGGGNIEVAKDGYYTITLNSITNKVKMEAADINPAPVEWIEMLGDFSGWDANPVKLTEKSGTEGAVWIGEVTLKEDGGLKFRADGKWDKNWGGKSFPYAQLPSGDNIPTIAGSYRVVFNQIDGCYFVFKNK